MTTRNLDSLINAGSVALVGASKTPGSLGAVLAHNLFNSGFDGPIMPVNPRHEAVEDVPTYPDAESLPLVPDLAVIATPPAAVPGLIAAFAERSTKVAVVITAGFGTHDGDGPAMWQDTPDAAQPHTMRIVAPNCLGVMVPGIGPNTSFAHRVRVRWPSSSRHRSPRFRERAGHGSPGACLARSNIRSLSATARKQVRGASTHNRAPPSPPIRAFSFWRLLM